MALKQIVHLFTLIGLLCSTTAKSQGDSCSTALPLTECVATSGNSISFTSGAEDAITPDEMCALNLEQTIWYSFTASSSGAYTVNITNTTIAGIPLIESGVFSGTCGTLTPINCNASLTNFSYSFIATSGTTYFIAVDGSAGNDVSFDLSVCPGCNAVSSFSASATTGPYPLTVNFTNNSVNASYYYWDFDVFGASYEGFSPAYVFEEPGTYEVSLIVFNGVCYDTSVVSIDVTGESILTAPNVFTPNEDGVNDLFKPIAKGIVTMHGKVYNRWGALVGEWEGINGYWDGYSVIAGIKVAEGTYFYEIVAEGYDGKMYDEKGKVQLFR